MQANAKLDYALCVASMNWYTCVACNIASCKAMHSVYLASLYARTWMGLMTYYGRKI